VLILTPDQRLRVFVSSTLEQLAQERMAARAAVERLHLTPMMSELAARPHPPQALYRTARRTAARTARRGALRQAYPEAP
jgi:hypothetical protein